MVTDRPEPDDPRALALAQARHKSWHAGTGRTPQWADLPPRDRELVLKEARDWLCAAVSAGLIPPADAPVELTIQYGFQLRDGTLLDFDTKTQRDRRMAEFVTAEWQVTPLIRQVRPAQYGEWAEETISKQRPHSPQTGGPRVQDR